jgi:uncharacterized protein YukE
MAQVRMDIEQVRAFGNDLKGKFAQELNSIKSNISSQSNGLNWEGTDAQQFKGDRTQQITQAIDQLVQRLEELGTRAIQNADTQEQVSTQV